MLKQAVRARFHVNEAGEVTGPKETQVPGSLDTSDSLYREFLEAKVSGSTLGKE